MEWKERRSEILKRKEQKGNIKKRRSLNAGQTDERQNMFFYSSRILFARAAAGRY